MNGLWAMAYAVVQGISLGIGFALGGKLVSELDKLLEKRRNRG